MHPGNHIWDHRGSTEDGDSPNRPHSSAHCFRIPHKSLSGKSHAATLKLKAGQNDDESVTLITDHDHSSCFLLATDRSCNTSYSSSDSTIPPARKDDFAASSITHSDEKRLREDPLPSLRGIDLDRTFGKEDCLGLDSPVERKDSKPRRRRPPSKQNQVKERKKSRKRKELKDDCRPDSDKDQFLDLHKAKEAHRLADKSSRKMAKTTKTTVSSDEENKEPAGGRTNHSANGQNGTTATDTVPTGPRGCVHPLSALPIAMQERFNIQLEETLAKDKKLAKDKLREALAKSRKTNLCLKFNNEILFEYKVEAAKLRKDNDELHQKLRERTSKSKAMVMRTNEAEKERILKVVNGDLWRVCKFIGCKDDEEKCSEYVYKLLYDTEPLDLDKMYSWHATYRKTIRDALYGKRNYATAQVKACAWKLFEAGIELPSVEMVRKCVNRTIDINDPEEMKVFKWYWECLLPKVVGAVEWGPSVRLYNLISTYKIPNDDRKRVLISPSNEGMILVLWENQFEKWHELWRFSQLPANRGKKQTNRGGKYTSCEKGQCDFSGWSAEGIEAFNTYVDEAKAARKGPNRKLLERTTLNQLRAQYGIDQVNHESQLKANRRKRKNLPNDAPIAALCRRVVRTRMLDEDEVEVDDDEMSEIE